jgi:small-conductance mechanosensitive channel
VRSVAQYSIFEPAPLTFVVLPVVLVGMLAWGTTVAWRRSGASIPAAARAAAVTIAAAGAWMAGTGIVAASGVLREWERTPPPFALLVAAIVAIAFGAAYGRLGSRIASTIPLWTLVLVQSFRLPLEVAMHAMYTRGVMPVQMTYTGLNFDIVTGATAIPVAFLVATGRGGPRLVAAWNIVGLGLLLNVVTVAILATPRFRYFGDDHLNIWVTYPPFVWLPAVMVLAALAGHLLIFRALSHQKQAVRR